MRFEFDAAGKHLAFVDALEPDYQDARTEKDLLAARRLVRAAAAGPVKSKDLRTFLVKTEGVQGANALSNAEVHDRVAWKLVLGEMRVETVGSKSVVLPTAVPPPAVVAAPPKKKEEKLSWVAFELVDENGKPVPGEPYEIVLPDGRKQTGRLNDQGEVNIPAIKDGTCKLTFPELDTKAWEPA